MGAFLLSVTCTVRVPLSLLFFFYALFPYFYILCGQGLTFRDGNDFWFAFTFDIPWIRWLQWVISREAEHSICELSRSCCSLGPGCRRLLGPDPISQTWLTARVSTEYRSHPRFFLCSQGERWAREDAGFPPNSCYYTLGIESDELSWLVCRALHSAFFQALPSAVRKELGEQQALLLLFWFLCNFGDALMNYLHRITFLVQISL